MKVYKHLILMVAVALFLSEALCACSVTPVPDAGDGQEIGTDHLTGDAQDVVGEMPVGGGIQTAALIADMSNGSPDENIKSNTHYSYEDITPEELAESLSSWTGLDFIVTISSGRCGRDEC